MNFPFQRFQVQGKSMMPTLKEGDRVLVFRSQNIKAGDIVVFYKNGMKMIKRAIKRNYMTWVMRGDNRFESSDSGDFGEIKSNEIIGKVIVSY